jgi:hypothetical protein
MNLTRCLIFVFVAFTLFSLVAIQEVKSESANVIVINNDCSVSDTNAIKRSGNIYSLTGDLYNSPIIIQCNNIILDGKGFTLQGPGGWPTPAALNLTCTNVTVQNFAIANWEVGILDAYNNNAIVHNNVTGNERDIAIYADNCKVTGNYLGSSDYAVRVIGNGNIFFQNEIVNYGFVFYIDSTLGNVITANDITFDNPIVFETDHYLDQVYHNNFINRISFSLPSNEPTSILDISVNASGVTEPPWIMAFRLEETTRATMQADIQTPPKLTTQE